MGTVNGTFSVGLVASHSVSSDLTSPNDLINLLFSETYASGTGSNQVNESWIDTRTVTAAPETLDLDSGVLINRFGETLTLSKVRVLIIRNKATTTGHILSLTGDFLIGLSITDNSPIQVVAPGGLLVMTSPIDGITVGVGADDLTVNPGVNTISYDIAILGVT